MKLKTQHANFLANRIVSDLSRSTFVKIVAPLPNISEVITNIVREDIQQELTVERKANDVLEKHQEEIEDSPEINEKQLFAMIKKQIAREEGFLLSHKERYSQLSHEILDELIEGEYIVCNVAENVVKNVIVRSFDSFLDDQESAYDAASEKMRNLKRKVVAGSDEYELIFAKLLGEELSKRGHK